MLATRETSEFGIGGSQDAYAYPKDLARFVRACWDDHARGADGLGYEPTEAPETPILERLFSTCYQASLLREEERPVTFRAILAAPEDLPEAGGPPGELHHPRSPGVVGRREVGEGSGLSEVPVGHPLLDAEGGLYVGLVRLSPLDLLLPYPEYAVDGPGLSGLEDPAPVGDEALQRTVLVRQLSC